jgi:4-alpha-glucanotransferase
MKLNRSAGILLHPTSLPGPFGIGDVGPAAHRWVDFLAESGCTLWQVLPLGPTGYGDSPYQCFSAFAGNPYLIAIDPLLEDGLLTHDDLAGMPAFPTGRVEFGELIPWKLSILDKAFTRFSTVGQGDLSDELAQFHQAQAHWLDDFALFMALKDAHGGAPWHTWEPLLRDRQPQALDEVRRQYAGPIDQHIFRQFLFFRQWERLRQHAHNQGIAIIGDAPIFVAHDSADVWANPHLFYLDQTGQPTSVAGVPPDYFSPVGQLWGNPLYRWDLHKETGYAWWISRLNAVLQLVDVIRLDHFRGFAGYWEVPAGETTAVNGRWVPGPGADFFHAVENALGELPLIAEDLGEITPDVFELRDQFNLPGMKVLHFAFYGNPDEKFLPHNYPQNCVAYTGTHDNDTTLGWFRSVAQEERDFCLAYLGRDSSDVVWGLIRILWSSVADYALAPMQDFLQLGTHARMNYPGRLGGNWSWRMPADALSESLRERIKAFNFIYGRIPPERRDPGQVSSPWWLP